MTSTDHTPTALEPDTLADVVAQVQAGQCDASELIARLRATQLVVEVEATPAGHEVVAVPAQSLCWLPVFTSIESWAQFLTAAGRGTERVGYGWLLGAELFDEVVPQLAAGTGVVLDPFPEPVLTLSPTITGEESDE